MAAQMAAHRWQRHILGKHRKHPRQLQHLLLASTLLFCTALTHFLALHILIAQVILPKDLSSQCCGMMFNSRGLKDAAVQKGTALEAALLEASQGGKIPIVCDTSPCLSQIKAGISEPGLRFALYEPVEFIRHFLVDKLEFSKVGGLSALRV
jgi:Fe-S oxidoreductase